jgi:hypothetical protein
MAHACRHWGKSAIDPAPLSTQLDSDLPEPEKEVLVSSPPRDRDRPRVEVSEL